MHDLQKERQRTAARPARHRPLSQGQAALASLPPLSLLVAEDNEMNRFVLESLLQGSAITLDFVENGQQALFALEMRPYDAALIDIRMPVLDGIGFKMRHADGVGRGLYHDLPTISCSANVLPEQLDHYARLGFAEHLGKPIDLLRLAECLERHALPDTRAP